MQYQIPQQSDAGLDPRIARSQGAIRGALLAELRAGRAFTSLTISEIAEQAGVTRKTFYARAGSLEQLVEGSFTISSKRSRRGLMINNC